MALTSVRSSQTSQILLAEEPKHSTSQEPERWANSSLRGSTARAKHEEVKAGAGGTKPSGWSFRIGELLHQECGFELVVAGFSSVTPRVSTRTTGFQGGLATWNDRQAMDSP
ncbi:unnamed protein product [Durusdinium trenchii]|uniref:Uncharacterized protein n=1 Tax=Durusdinium trenchii TaxID=1381693 RepID=A0ABP0KJQ5_9DINO